MQGAPLGTVSVADLRGAMELLVEEQRPKRCAQVRAWRVRGRVPLSLDVTASLVEAQLQDAVAGAARGLLSDAALRSVFAAPIIRCGTPPCMAHL